MGLKIFLEGTACTAKSAMLTEFNKGNNRTYKELLERDSQFWEKVIATNIGQTTYSIVSTFETLPAWYGPNHLETLNVYDRSSFSSIVYTWVQDQMKKKEFDHLYLTAMLSKLALRASCEYTTDTLFVIFFAGNISACSAAIKTRNKFDAKFVNENCEYVRLQEEAFSILANVLRGVGVPVWCTKAKWCENGEFNSIEHDRILNILKETFEFANDWGGKFPMRIVNKHWRGNSGFLDRQNGPPFAKFDFDNLNPRLVIEEFLRRENRKNGVEKLQLGE